MVRAMVGGCCVCLDERGWDENPLVYCDGHGCSVAVHQACYGIVKVPHGPWFCCKCQSTERIARVKCELCPLKDGALKRTDSGGWAHVVCALYIPEVKFGNVATMQPIILSSVPHERYMKTCYICEENGRESKTASGACMACNKPGCRHAFHVTCAQSKRLLCEEGSHNGNVQYVGYCQFHFAKKNKTSGPDTDAKAENGKDKKRSRQDSVSSVNSDIHNASHSSESPATVKRGKKASVSAKPPPGDGANCNGQLPRQLPPPMSTLPDAHPMPVPTSQPARPTTVGSGACQNSTSYYPVSHSHFTMEDLLKRTPTPNTDKSLPNGVVMPSSSAAVAPSSCKTQAPSESAPKKRRLQSAKPSAQQKPKKQKSVPSNGKVDHVKKIRKKAIKIQQTSSSAGDTKVAKGNSSKDRRNSLQDNLVKPSMWNLMENGDPTRTWTSNSKVLPESFQELLEFQWSEGTQFLMQRAMNFDVSSLLTCLHQLKSDNTHLESRLNDLLRRRDRLSATNARLAFPLGCDQSAGQQPNPMSALLSHLRGSMDAAGAGQMMEGLPRGKDANIPMPLKNPTTPTSEPAVQVKTEKKAPRSKPAKKKSEQSSASAKKTPKPKPPTILPVTAPAVVTTAVHQQSVPALSPAMERLMQPMMSHHVKDKNTPIMPNPLPTTVAVCKAPEPATGISFVIQSPSRIVSPAQLLPSSQHHSPATYGPTQAALPQASGAVGFLVSELQHPYNMPRVFCGNVEGATPSAAPIRIESVRKQPSNIQPAVKHGTSPEGQAEKSKVTNPVLDK